MSCGLNRNSRLYFGFTNSLLNLLNPKQRYQEALVTGETIGSLDVPMDRFSSLDTDVLIVWLAAI
jgi:hypothetical protein